MIVVEYIEKIDDPASGATSFPWLGTESHDNIDEILLPARSTPTDPIFITKKFAAQDEYRWEVVSVDVDYSRASIAYIVTLARREKVPKEFYLRNLLKTKNILVKRILFKNAIVEVEYGHPMEVGDDQGHSADSRRYVDTLQKGSMPKRRLAIVNQVIAGPTEELVQVIPISSKRPLTPASSLRVVDVTASLTNLVHYQRQSWAICDMIETVSPNRIMAPLRKQPAVGRKPYIEKRDTNFSVKISNAMRQQLNDAMLYSVDQVFRMTAESELQVKVADLEKRASALEAEIQAIAASFGTTVDELRNAASI